VAAIVYVNNFLCDLSRACLRVGYTLGKAELIDDPRAAKAAESKKLKSNYCGTFYAASCDYPAQFECNSGHVTSLAVYQEYRKKGVAKVSYR